ncbi:unnamed protein product [Macrosiphum euphorbiae]|uniref:Uncharacterized protein n=1 Tax=Macrosiphum euphorbiae TaxID=13131 RepID=A0AAV0XWP3_9HEMI|nr:unnamed protein product [Macrosiphum euphorbiae]
MNDNQQLLFVLFGNTDGFIFLPNPENTKLLNNSITSETIRNYDIDYGLGVSTYLRHENLFIVIEPDDVESRLESIPQIVDLIVTLNIDIPKVLLFCRGSIVIGS